MNIYELNETTIFDGETSQIIIPVELDLRLEDIQSPVTIMAKGLGVGESVSIWFSVDDGETYTEYMTGGSQLTVTENDNIRACYSGAFLGFTKTASSSPVTVVANVRVRGE